jgi:hypothetical protein
MNDMQLVTNHIGSESKIWELTLSEMDAVSGARIIQAPAPQIGLFVAEVFTRPQVLRIR